MPEVRVCHLFVRAAFLALIFSVSIIRGATAQQVTPPNAPVLTLPIDCQIGADCFLQNYVDIDPGPDVRDYRCFAAGYDGHKGTDFRVLNLASPADVIAAAPGVVRGIRDGMVDRLVTGEVTRAAVKGRECGNGVVLDHGNGWQTQYCHLSRGSVAVANGDRVERGQKLGRTGASGFAAFPHVHLTVRHNGQVIEPFLASVFESPAQCIGTPQQTTPARGLWRDDISASLTYRAGEIIELGFASKPVEAGVLETAAPRPPTKTASAFVFYARMINLHAGDRIALRLVGPNGVIAERTSDPLDRNKAHWVSFAGRRLRADAWPSGSYTGEVRIIRDSTVYSAATTQLTLK